MPPDSAKNQSSGAQWRPTAHGPALEARAGLLARIREFFSARAVLEVETPVLSRAGNSDPGLRQLVTRETGQWLRTSPEYAMKRLLAAGSGDIYELGRVFRAGESGRQHNCEFTMLEWYRLGWNCHELMDEVAALVRFCGPEHRFEEQKMSYRELFRSHAEIDPFTTDVGMFGRYARARNLDVPDLDHRQWLDFILSHVIQPRLPQNCMTFVFDYPADQAALAKIRPGDPPLAERFECFLGQVELANGYHELTDAGEQRERFVSENAARKARGDEETRLDEHLLSALSHGLPDCSGVALGVDRLLACLLGAESLEDVIAFPDSRA